jgi:hypothetical protein
MLAALQSRLAEILRAAPTLAGVTVIVENPDDVKAVMDAELPHAATITISQPGLEYPNGSTALPSIEFAVTAETFPFSPAPLSVMDLTERALAALNGATWSISGSTGKFEAERFAAGPVGAAQRKVKWGYAPRGTALPKAPQTDRGYCLYVRTTAPLK